MPSLVSPYRQTPKGKSRFCYHLFYWRITHMQHPYGGDRCCTLTVPVSEVVIRLTSYHRPLRQSKLLAGRTFTPLQLVASHLRGWGSRLKLTTGSHCVPSHIRTGLRCCNSRHTSLDPVCMQPHWPHVYLSIVSENGFKCDFAQPTGCWDSALTKPNRIHILLGLSRTH